MDLAGKNILITGAASGIGRALAQRFAQADAAQLLLVDLDGQAVEEVAAQLRCAVARRVDVTVEAEVAGAVHEAQERFGQLDLVCSNAGIACGDGSGLAAVGGSNADWQRSWEVNVMAHVYAARAALPQMLERGSGYFLHTASAAGLLSQIGSAAYSATKHAAIGFAEALAIAHGDAGIGVSVLCPQAVRTPMLPGGDSAPQSGDGILEPAQVAEAVVDGLRAERFLILPHPEVTTYMQRKTTDYDRWLSGMRRLRRRVSPG